MPTYRQPGTSFSYARGGVFDGDRGTAVTEPSSTSLGPLATKFVHGKTPACTYRFACSYYPRNDEYVDLQHELYEFVWDGKCNAADPSSTERADAFEKFSSCQVHCKCGQMMRLVSKTEIKKKVSVKKRLDRKIAELETKLNEAMTLLLQMHPSVLFGDYIADRPLASAVSQGTLFFDRDTGEMSISAGNQWAPIQGHSMPTLTAEEVAELRKRLRLDEQLPFVPQIAKTDQKPPTISAESKENPMSQNSASQTPEEAKPTLTRRVLETVKSDGADAAWRVAGVQFVRLAREPLIAKLAERLSPGDESMRVKMAAFLATDAGEALVGMFLSLGLGMMPKSFGSVPERLAQELRVASMAGALDMVTEVVTKPLRELITSGILDDALAQVQTQELTDGARIPNAAKTSAEQMAVRDASGTTR